MSINRTLETRKSGTLRNNTLCSSCRLSGTCVPQGLDRDDVEKLETLVKRLRPLRPGEHLFRAGDSFQTIYAVRSGAVKVYRFNSDFEEQIIGFYLPGEVVGFNSIKQEKYVCSAVALETSSFCAFSFSRVEEVCRSLPGLQHQMFRLMSKEIASGNDRITSHCTTDARQKVATFLLSLSKRYQHQGYSAREFRLAMSRREVGLYLGMALETVSRTLSQMQRDNLITVDRKSVMINDLPALQQTCSGMGVESGHTMHTVLRPPPRPLDEETMRKVIREKLSTIK